jgi:hypothetical protein
MLYQIQEGYLALDGAWQDRSINMLVPTEKVVEGVNLVVTRDVLPPGTSLNDHMARQKLTFQKELTDYKQLHEMSGVLDERPAHFLEFTWINGGKPLYQMVMVVHDKSALLNFTASIPGIADADTRRFLLQTMRSFKFGAPTEGALA